MIMYVCMLICFIYTCMLICFYVCVYVNILLCICLCKTLYVCTYGCMQACVNECMYVCVMYVCMYVCVLIFKSCLSSTHFFVLSPGTIVTNLFRHQHMGRISWPVHNNMLFLTDTILRSLPAWSPAQKVYSSIIAYFTRV